MIGGEKSLPVRTVPRLSLLSGPSIKMDRSYSAHSTSLALVVILAIAFMLPSLVAYGPWKPDEPYTFGLVDNLLKTGDWIVPTLAGEPFMEKPPLFVWVAALTAKLASPWLDLEYGARLAIGVFMLIALVATASAARRWWGNGLGRYAVLALLASIGLQQHGRMMIPDLPLLAGVAVAFCGWAWIQERPHKGGILFGTGLGMTFMAKGLLGPGALALSALMLPLLFRAWRTRAYTLAMLCAFAASLPWLLIWPTALYLHSPQLFTDWFWTNNVGRFLGSSVSSLGASHESGHLIETIPWFTFPALPLAIWSLWKMRFNALNHPGFQVSLTVLIILVTVFAESASGRVVYLLPMLIPTAIMSAPAIKLLPPSLSLWLDWIARFTFGAVAAICWVIWFCYFVANKPLLPSFVMKYLPINLPFAVDPLGLVIALLLLAGWCGVLRQLPRIAARATVSFASGIILVWGTAFALLLPWIDAAKSYQSTFSDMSQVLGGHSHCLASKGLGESERAMLAYTTDIMPQRLEISRGKDCDALLWQGTVDNPPRVKEAEGWQLTWEGSRPGEHRERFWLFMRAHDSIVGRNGD